jgi:endoglucanase
LLEKLICIPSVSGREDAMREYIKEEIAEVFDEVKTDSLGNLICHRSGKEKALVLMTHMDCEGLIATYTDGDNVSVAPLGSIKAQHAAYRRITFFTGNHGLLVPPQSYSSETKISDFRVQLGSAPEKEIPLGTKAYFDDDLLSLEGDFVSSATISSRVGVACLINAAKKAEFSDREIYFIFTAQECLGGRGAKSALDGINAEEIYNFRAVSLGKNGNTYKVGVGNGAAVNVMGKGFVSETEMAERIENLCADNGLKAVLFTDANKVTDATFAGKAGEGCSIAEICIPVDNMGSAAEVLKLSDAINACDIAKALIK